MRRHLKQTPIVRAIQVLALFGVQSISYAQPEFASFKLTGVEGFVSATYQTNGVVSNLPDVSNQNTTRSSQRQTDLRFETSLMTHSYIYHPKLLALDLGVGVVAGYGRTDSDGLISTNHDQVYNISARATAFSDKPAHGAVFYERLHSTPSMDPGEIFNQTNQRYGFTAAVLAPLTPVPLGLEYTRERNQGSSTTRVVDDQINRLQFKAERLLSKYGATRFDYYSVQQVSASGSALLPVQETRMDSRGLSLGTNLKLGTESPYELNNNISYSTQRYARESDPGTERSDLGFGLNYNGSFNPQWRHTASYQFGRSRQGDLATYSDAASALTTWTATKDVNVAAGVHLNDARSPQFSSHAQGVDGSVGYARELALGSMRAGYSLRYEKRNQTATDTQVAIIGERVTLTSTTPISLSRKLVTAASVLVQNATRSQTFVEGIDYAQSVVGVTTRIQRLLSGNILDGEDVLVDYVFDFGGTYASTQTDQSVDLSWALSNMFGIYARYSESKPQLVSGQPTSPLNTVRSRLVGARADVPVSSRVDLVVGGRVEREVHDETISPYVRSEGEAYIRGEFPLDISNNYRFGARRTRTEADDLRQDSDVLAYDLLLGVRLQSGLSLNAIGLYERNQGGIDLRVRKTATLKALWRYRRLSFSADLSRTQESQGLYARDQTIGRLDLRRDF